MSAARYVVRSGKVRGEGWYIERTCNCAIEYCEAAKEEAHADPMPRAEAARQAKRWGGRVVRLLSSAEVGRKAAATALREHAALCRNEALTWAAMKSASTVNVAHAKGIGRGYEKAAEFADRQADALWKRRAK